ncbi:hypothetical protein D3C86_1381640 [compost metagenome]
MAAPLGPRQATQLFTQVVVDDDVFTNRNPFAVSGTQERLHHDILQNAQQSPCHGIAAFVRKLIDQAGKHFTGGIDMRRGQAQMAQLAGANTGINGFAVTHLPDANH